MMAADLNKQQALALNEQYKKQSKSNTTNQLLEIQIEQEIQ